MKRNDLFVEVVLSDFLAEETRLLMKSTDRGVVIGGMVVGTLLQKFTHEVVRCGMHSALNEDGSADPARGRDTVLRVASLLAVGAALSLKDIARNVNAPETFPEIDMLVSWYRQRYPR